MKHEGMTLKDGHDLVKSKRNFVRPNRGFWEQLIEYEAQIFKTNTVEMRMCKNSKYTFV